MSFRRSPLARCIALAVAAGVSGLALAESSGTDEAPLTLAGGDRLSVDAGGLLSSQDTTVTLDMESLAGGSVIDNRGSLISTGDRAIDSENDATTPQAYRLFNRADALIQGQDDALRLKADLNNGSVVVDNAGIIHSAEGQAIDFDKLTNADITVINRASGVIRSDGNDGIRPGSNARLINYGIIQAGDMVDADAKNDGVDLQAETGVIVENHGTISGGRHGITTDEGATLINYQGAVVLGRNGSGFGSDGDGVVTNYGTITGAFSGLSLDDGLDDGIDDLVPTGDGDGVDIDGLGTLVNYGTIQGVGAGGYKDDAANTSEGIAMGGGSVVNHVGAVISGAANGILIDDSEAGGAPYAFSLENHGIVRGLDGYGVRIIGTRNDTVINDGLISGTDGTALDLGGGDDQLVLRHGSRFIGRVDGGDGDDTVTLDDAAGGRFGNSQGFETLEVLRGVWTVSSEDFSNGGNVAGGATLINQGSITGVLSVADGGTYAGTGSLGGLDLSSGSTLVYGFSDGAAQSAVAVAGTANLDGTLQLTSDGSPLRAGTYRLLDAGSVTGGFSRISSDFVFLEPDVITDADGADLVLARNGVAFADVAGSSSAASVARSLDGSAGTLHDSLLGSDRATARGGLQQLAGVSNANLASATLASTGQVGSVVQGAMLQFGSLGGGLQASLLRDDGPRLAALGVPEEARHLNDPAMAGRLWLQGLGSHGRTDGQDGASDVRQDTGGALIGADWAATGGWRLGVAGGYSHTDIDAGDGNSGDLDSYHLAGYALRAFGALSLRLGAAYSWHDGESRRLIDFGAFSDRPTGRYDADSQALFAEVGYDLSRGRLLAEPFAGLGYQRYHRDGYEEKGGAAALSVSSQTQDNVNSQLGLRLGYLGQLENGMSFTPRMSVGWRHTFGNVDPSVRQTFLTGGDAFTAQGTALDRNSLLLDAGAELGVTATQSVSLMYRGEGGSDSRNHALVAQWQMAF